MQRVNSYSFNPLWPSVMINVCLTFGNWYISGGVSRRTVHYSTITAHVAQVAPDVPRDKKILQPGDYHSDVDHYRGDWKTMVRKSKSLVPGF